jgi:hypothetical protein
MRVLGTAMLATFLVLVTLPLAASTCLAAEESFETTVLIEEGGLEAWDVGGDKDVHITVEVLNGTSVDVYLAKSYEPPDITIFEGNSFEGVEKVDETFKRGNEETIILIVDNSDLLGIISDGPVEVRVMWEPQASPLLLFALVMVPVIIAIVVGYVLFTRYLRAHDPEEDWIADGEEELAEIADAESGIFYEPYTLSDAGKVQHCPSCGEEMSFDERTRTTYCGNCTLPPPELPPH